MCIRDRSHTGKAKKDDAPSIESRGQLYMWMREVIGITKPKMFIAENVKGLTNLRDVKEIIEKDFSSVGDGGYLVEMCIRDRPQPEHRGSREASKGQPAQHLPL